MAYAVVLFTWTEQGIRTVKDSPRRIRESVQQAEERGVRIHGPFLTLGEYDLAAIVEAPSDEAVATAILTLGMQGNVRTTTLKAFSLDELERMVGQLP